MNEKLFSETPVFIINNKFAWCCHRSEVICSSACIKAGITWNRNIIPHLIKPNRKCWVYFWMFETHFFFIYSIVYRELLGGKPHFGIQRNIFRYRYESVYHRDTIQCMDVDHIVQCIRNALYVRWAQLYLSKAKIKWILKQILCLHHWLNKKKKKKSTTENLPLQIWAHILVIFLDHVMHRQSHNSFESVYRLVVLLLFLFGIFEEIMNVILLTIGSFFIEQKWLRIEFWVAIVIPNREKESIKI